MLKSYPQVMGLRGGVVGRCLVYGRGALRIEISVLVRETTKS